MKDQFVVPARLKKTSFVLMGVGLLTLLIGLFAFQGENATRFWAGLLQNSSFFLLITLASTFFIAATTLAHGGWQIAFRRVPEAISMAVPVLAAILFVIVMILVFGGKDEIYHWVNLHHVHEDKILSWKSPFLNKSFFTIATILTLGLWIFFTLKLRNMSIEEDGWDLKPATGKKILWRNTVVAGGFLVVFTLSVGSTTPWLWLMSIDAHWFSTMYSWYTFASTWVSGLSLIALFVVYLKKHGYLTYVTEEHLHDLGKFMFAFSIFWTYLWFSQYMLIWYANMPEETAYFQPRVWGEWRPIFFLNLLINFITPLLFLMKRDTKRNYTAVVFMAFVIIAGHWMDFWQMVYPATVKHLVFPWYELGLGLGFVGLIIFLVSNALTKAALVPKNHPYLKESIIHHT
ncbi:quinol:cytochrome c oxidoreductase quinone-binding subunit 2 [Chitinophaga jiangningensis]|uniref:Quinol:cytochrome c oxidoreductase quinone-binding subunit 2 n=1 Tax=Chitinophaga jiangningensis TaxID=1419482 RepID=A0A1M7E3N7_9BACT|nr:quinol:cytochrome C oxidoreductase [Chitinophaga jiangningensis]SHL86296.1 quinol:cytochrome c oxidoreductase quinone-binding subunit 2 [Chitinophaga jiangningensis]